MKEKVLLIFFLCNVALFVSAQSHMEKGLQSISRSSTEAIINFLAGDELQGREAGFHVTIRSVCASTMSPSLATLR